MCLDCLIAELLIASNAVAAGVEERIVIVGGQGEQGAHQLAGVAANARALRGGGSVVDADFHGGWSTAAGPWTLRT